ncbi:MAG: hypothetical protein ABL871_03645 [Terricaulis sp.]
MSGDRTRHPGEYIRDAAWLPHAYDADRDAFVFAHLPRDLQRRVVFIDRRFVPKQLLSPLVPIADLPLDLIDERRGPLHFIFHTGFCGSTLLSRALDIPGVSMGLKEPAILTSMGRALHGGHEIAEPLDLSLRLLSRPLVAGETQIVKPSNATNPLAREMMRSIRGSKALVLYSDLQAFLCALVRRNLQGRIMGRNFFCGFMPAIPLQSRYGRDELLKHTDLQIAAHAWLMQVAALERLAQRFGPDRVRFIKDTTLFHERPKTLQRVADFFELNMTPEQIDSLSRSGVFDEEAKKPGAPFDAAKREEERASANAIYEDELVHAQNWARELAARSVAPLTLREDIFD